MSAFTPPFYFSDITRSLEDLLSELTSIVQNKNLYRK